MMDNELILEEYKLYTAQKDRFTDRNFATNKFYFVLYIITILGMIYTGNIVFMKFLSATLLFSVIGVSVCVLWYMNVDNYNTMIKIKFADVIEKIEEKLPVRPYQDEYKALKDIREKKVFMFSDIQKFVSVIGALFFFAVFVSEISPIMSAVLIKIKTIAGLINQGI